MFGGNVRISHLQRAFELEYTEPFIESSRGMKLGVSYYTLQDEDGEKVRHHVLSATII